MFLTSLIGSFLFFLPILDCELYAQKGLSYRFYTASSTICYKAPVQMSSHTPVIVYKVGSLSSELEILNSNYAKDSRHVYFAELYTPCPDCFTSVNELGILKEADPETFHIDEDGFPRDKHRTYERLAEPWEYFEK